MKFDKWNWISCSHPFACLREYCSVRKLASFANLLINPQLSRVYSTIKRMEREYLYHREIRGTPSREGTDNFHEIYEPRDLISEIWIFLRFFFNTQNSISSFLFPSSFRFKISNLKNIVLLWAIAQELNFHHRGKWNKSGTGRTQGVQRLVKMRK